MHKAFPDISSENHEVKMKILLLILFVSLIPIVAACDVRSEIAKKNMDKFVSSPTPPMSPTPVGTPIDPADIVEVNVNLKGKTIYVDGDKQRRAAACAQFDRVMVNGDNSEIKVNGACSQIMINGDGNKITADAVSEFVLNGSENTVRYSRFVNGKLPSVIENRAGNIIEKISVNAAGKK